MNDIVMPNQKEIIEIEKEKIKVQLKQQETIQKIVDKGLPLIQRYFTSKIEKIEAPRFKWTFIIFGGLLFASLVGTGLLTYYDKISSENFTFLLGILIGSIVTLMGDIVLQVKE